MSEVMEKVKERPILFSGEMVRAILAGNKTMTRRVMKPQPVKAEGLADDGNDLWIWAERKRYGAVTSWAEPDTMADEWALDTCPYGKVGDRLWVRETWHIWGIPNELQFYDYRATCPDADELKWKPSIFMPRAASRILLEVTGVRVERVQNISESDAKAEGFDHEIYNPYPTCATHMPPEWYELPPSPKGECSGPRWDQEWYPSSERMKRWKTRNNFIRTWELLNKKRGYGWESNPFVWVVEFKRVEGAQ